jgi:NADH-quinone oxidoreductase subunit G
MATIFIDNRPYEVKDGQNLLQACLSLGFNVPYFCWHPAMQSVGSCRQCAVKQFKDENDTKGRIVMSCMTPAADGTRISIDDPDAIHFRKSNIEWLMLNHPHDCPVCDEGGECHLQDMTVMTGHNYRKTRFKKRSHRNQYLGPFINHEMNRCIHCYRCVRFYRDHAGGLDMNVFASHDNVYFGRYEEGVLESEFSGNLVEVCPTGVFTDKTLKDHYTRKWDLQTAPSVCVHCGLGCNTIPGERYGKLRRIRNRYNSRVNGYFLCDRGRYGYEFVNCDKRLHQPLLITSGAKKQVNRKEMLEHLSGLLYFGAKVIGIGSPRASLEANYALRTLVGPEHFYQGFSETDYHLISLIGELLQKSPARSPSLHDAATADTVFVIGEDITNTAPMLALSLRQSIRQKPMEICERFHIPEWNEYAVCNAIQDEKGPLFIAAPSGTKLDAIASATYHAAPEDIARSAFAIAHAIDPDAPQVSGLPDEVSAFVQTVAQALNQSKHPLIISGMSSASSSVIQAASNIASALCRKNKSADLCFIVPECNALGLGLIGGGSLNNAFETVRDGTADTVIILENDLYRRTEKDMLDDFFRKCRHVIAIDSSETPTTSQSEVLLPSGTFAETDGTFVNNEGRAQRFFKVFPPEENIQESWRWVLDLMTVAERPEAMQWKLLDDITIALSDALPVFNPVREISPPAGFRIAGMKIPRQPHRCSGRTSMHSHINVHEPKTPEDPDSPLSFSMEGYEGIPPSSLIARFWSPGWNSVQSVNKFQREIAGPLLGGDPGQRLIEPNESGSISYFQEIPAAFNPRTDEYLLVPLYHIFGSEEMSVLSPAVAELMPQPYIGLNADDMESLQIHDGEKAETVLNGKGIELPVKCIKKLPKGIAGLPVGLPGLQGILRPLWIKGLKRRGEK